MEDFNVDNGLNTDSNADHDQELTMTYSAVYRGRDNKKTVRVSFERTVNGKKQSADGILPEGRIEKAEGYTAEEVSMLEQYLKDNSVKIIELAEKIKNPFFNM